MFRALWIYLAKKLGYKVVITEDFDGECRYRAVKETPFGKLATYGITKRTRIWLEPDGSITPDCYVKRWKSV